MSTKNTFKRKERLKSKIYFDAIFEKRYSLKHYPIRAIFVSFDQVETKRRIKPENSQVSFSVPKKRFKHAVDRNRIKRQMLEAYRLNKTLLTNHYAIIFIYLPKQKMDYNEIEAAMKNVLKDIEQHIIES